MVTTLLSPLVGELYDELGFANAYLVLGGVVTINLLLSAWLLEGRTGRHSAEMAKMTGG